MSSLKNGFGVVVVAMTMAGAPSDLNPLAVLLFEKLEGIFGMSAALQIFLVYSIGWMVALLATAWFLDSSVSSETKKDC